MDIELDQRPIKPNPTQGIPVYMITVPSSFESMHYAKKTWNSWGSRGYTVNVVPALKAEDPFYQFYADRFLKVERTFGKKGSRKFYKSEISRFLSHVKLWQSMVEKKISRAFIIEHDCELNQHVPSYFLNTNIGFLARGAYPSFFTNYTSSGIKSCTGYYIRIDYAERLLEDFRSLPIVNFNIEKYLYVMSIFDVKYSATHFVEATNVPAIELYDPEIGNTVKDELKKY